MTSRILGRFPSASPCFRYIYSQQRQQQLQQQYRPFITALNSTGRKNNGPIACLSTKTVAQPSLVCPLSRRNSAPISSAGGAGLPVGGAGSWASSRREFRSASRDLGVVQFNLSDIGEGIREVVVKEWLVTWR